MDLHVPEKLIKEFDGPEDRRFRRWIGTGLRYLIPAGCSFLLIWWMLRKIDFAQMMAIIRHGVNYWFILAMMIVTVLSHMVRAQRWRLQIAGTGVRPTYADMCVSIFGNYALNLVLPRAGEIWRCLFIARRYKVSLSTIVGTMVGDRTSDAVVVVLLTGLAFIVAAPALDSFLAHYEVWKTAGHYASDPWLWGGLALGIAVIWGAVHFFRNYKFMDEIDGQLRRGWDGFVVLFTTMPHKWEFCWLTLGIWTCYFAETYLCFFAFDFTRALITANLCWGLVPGLVAFVFGSLSMVVPSNGGLGPWNISVMFALSLYGIAQVEGAAFAMLMWSAQSLTLIILGIYCIIYISLTQKRAHLAQKSKIKAINLKHSK